MKKIYQYDAKMLSPFKCSDLRLIATVIENHFVAKELYLGDTVSLKLVLSDHSVATMIVSGVGADAYLLTFQLVSEGAGTTFSRSNKVVKGIENVHLMLTTWFGSAIQI